MTCCARLGGEELGHRRLARDARARDVAASMRRGRRAARDGVDVDRHVAELGLRQLELGERAAEQLPLRRPLRCASSSARRAKPSAAAPTVERKTSSVAIAILKPSPGSPSSAVGRDAALVEAQRAERMRRDRRRCVRDASSPGVVGVDDEGRQAPWLRAPRRCARTRRSDRRGRALEIQVLTPSSTPVVAVARRRRRDARRRPSRHPARTARRRRSRRRRRSPGSSAASARRVPNSVTGALPSPCIANAKSARPERAPSISRARHRLRTSSFVAQRRRTRPARTPAAARRRQLAHQPPTHA